MSNEELLSAQQVDASLDEQGIEESWLKEWVAVFRAWPSWIFLSFNDIRTKYRRALLGPWWVVLGMGGATTMMALVWSIIFNLDWRHYLPYMMAGIITWHWISTYMSQSCDIFANEFGNLLRSLPTPPLVHALRFVMRAFWLFLHYLPIWAGAALITGIWPTFWSMLFFPLGLAIVLINAVSITIILGMAGARFRDLSPAVTAVMAPMMLLTPVMWHPEMLGRYTIIAWINPFTHYIALIREPLLGHFPSLFNILFVAVSTVCLVGFAAWCYRRYRRVLVLWV